VNFDFLEWRFQTPDPTQLKLVHKDRQQHDSFQFPSKIKCNKIKKLKPKRGNIRVKGKQEIWGSNPTLIKSPTSYQQLPITAKLEAWAQCKLCTWALLTCDTERELSKYKVFVFDPARCNFL